MHLVDQFRNLFIVELKNKTKITQDDVKKSKNDIQNI